MNNTIKKVFMIVGLLVVIFLVWQLLFNDGGIIKTGYNAVVKGINGQWEKVSGKGQVLIPEWDSTNAASDANGQGFEISTDGK